MLGGGTDGRLILLDGLLCAAHKIASMGETLKLLQAWVPEAARDEVTRRAAESGLSQSAWLRQLVLKEVKMDGRGRRIRPSTRR